MAITNSWLPQHATGSETWANFVQAAPLCGYIYDRTSKTFFFSPIGVNNSLVSDGTGGASVAEINTSGLNGVTLDGDNEAVNFWWKPELGTDWSKDITFRTYWSNTTAAVTGSARLKYKYKALIAGTTAIAVAATEISTQPADQADSATAHCLQVSGWGTLTGGTITTFANGDDLMAVKCYVDLTTVTDCTVYASEIRYYRSMIA